MKWSILVDCFYSLNDISFSLEDHKDEHVEKQIEKLKSLLKDDDKNQVDKLITSIIFHLDMVAYNYCEKAIHFGVYCGMEMQQALDKYFEE